MNTQSECPDEKLDPEVVRLLEERDATAERDAADAEEWTPELKKQRIDQLKQTVPH